VRTIDLGAPVTAGAGCASVGPNEAFCADVALGDRIIVLADDMNDYVNAAAAAPEPRRLDGGPGDDVLDSGNGGSLDGGPGADTFVTVGGLIDYSSRTNPVTVTVGDDLANDGEAGEDDLVPSTVFRIRLGHAADTLTVTDVNAPLGIQALGEEGNDHLTSIESPGTRLFGGPGDDVLEGHGPAVLTGNGGNDTIVGKDGTQFISGGPGDDDLRGGPDSDSVFGNDGADVLGGGKGGDFLRAGAGSDTLYAQDGYADFVDGDHGVDTGYVDAGRDTVRQVEKLYYRVSLRSASAR